MHLEVVARAAALKALTPEWWELWHEAGATPFQSPAWLLSWFESFGASAELYALSLRSSGKLVALLPLSLFSFEGERWAAPLGAGISDYLDVLIAPGARREVSAPLRNALLELAKRVDRLQLDDVPETSALHELLECAKSEPCAPCPAWRLGRWRWRWCLWCSKRLPLPWCWACT